MPVTHDHRVVLEFVKSLQRDTLLLQLPLFPLSLLLDFLSLLFLLFILDSRPLRLLFSKVVLLFLLWTDLDGGNPLFHLVHGGRVEQDAVFGDPRTPLFKFAVLRQTDAYDVAVGQQPAVVIDVFSLSLNKTRSRDSHS